MPKSEYSIESKSTFYTLLPILLCGLAIPLSLFLWIGNLAFSFVTQRLFGNEEIAPIPPTRFLFSTLVPILLMAYGLKRKGVNYSGAGLGLIVAIILSLASHAFLACLATFFFSSSRVTKFRSHLKRKIEVDFKGGEGKRNWIQVLCNGGMATQLALLYLLDCGSGERPIDFVTQYRPSWLAVAVMSAFACCNGDTWASEIGSVCGNSEPFLITTGRKVERGVNGAVSFLGIVSSMFGGIAIGVSYFLVIYYVVDRNILASSPPQWPIILFGGIAGLLGSLIDSLLGATVQYSGLDLNNRVVERPGENIRHISGYRILDNHSVNLISSILTALIMPFIAFSFWAA